MADWFRSWHGAPMDPKWLGVGRIAGVKRGIVAAVWHALEDYASQHAKRGTVAGFDVCTYAEYSEFDEADVVAVIGALTERKVIVDGRLANWDKRQPKREDDSATERTARHRERRVTKRDAQHVTHSHASSAQSRVESETDRTTTTTSREDDFAFAAVEAAGEALGDPKTIPGLASTEEFERWQAGACDPQSDILPTIRRLSATKPPASVKTWRFFSEAIFEARDKRLSARAPPPVIDLSAHQSQQRPFTHERKPKRNIVDALFDQRDPAPDHSNRA